MKRIKAGDVPGTGREWKWRRDAAASDGERGPLVLFTLWGSSAVRFF